MVYKAGAPDIDMRPHKTAVYGLAKLHGQTAVIGVLAETTANGTHLTGQKGVPLNADAEAALNNKLVQKVAHVGEFCIMKP